MNTQFTAPAKSQNQRNTTSTQPLAPSKHTLRDGVNGIRYIEVRQASLASTEPTESRRAAGKSPKQRAASTKPRSFNRGERMAYGPPEGDPIDQLQLSRSVDCRFKEPITFFRFGQLVSPLAFEDFKIDIAPRILTRYHCVMVELNRNLFPEEKREGVSITIEGLPSLLVSATIAKIGRSISADHLEITIRCQEPSTLEEPKNQP